MKETVYLRSVQAGWHRVEGRARLDVVVVYPVVRRRDVDNLHSNLKPLIDAIAQAYLGGRDDTDALDLHVSHRVDRGRRYTTITLAQASEPGYNEKARREQRA